jgi:predicted porin
MKSKLTALKAITVPAVLATSFAGTAFAQSNVTLFGVVDLAVAHGSGSVS